MKLGTTKVVLINIYEITLYSLQIDESSFQCLTCNDVLALKSKSAHFDGTDHKKLYFECRQAYIAFYGANEKENPPGEVSEVVEKPKTSATTAEEQKLDPENYSKKEEIVNHAKKSDPLEVKTEAIPGVSAKNSITPTEPAEKSTPEVKKHEKPKGKLEKITTEFDEEVCKAFTAKEYVTMDYDRRKWCLLCDWDLENTLMDVHIASQHHQTLLKMHEERIEKKKLVKLGSEKHVAAQKEQKPQETRNPILDMLSELEKNDIMVDCNGNVAFCKRCSKALDFNHLAIESHIIEQHKGDKKGEVKETDNIDKEATNNKKVDDAKKPQKIVENIKKPQSPITKKAQSMKKHERESESRASSAASMWVPDEDIEKLAKANNLTYNRNSNKMYCPVCDSHILSTIRNINQHVLSTTHKNNTTMSMRPNFIQARVKRAMKDVITDVLAVENTFSRDVIINRIHVLNYYSFIMITKQHRLKCEACEIYLNSDQVEVHKVSQSHHRAMCETMVIVSFESEFIREVS